MPATKVNIVWLGFSGEKSSHNIYFQDHAQGANWGTIFGVAGNYDQLKASLITTTRMNHVRSTMSDVVDLSTPSVPTDPMAQREIKILWVYADNVTGKTYRFEVPGPVDAILQSGTDQIDLVSNIIASSFKSVFEAQCVSPDGNAVTLQSGRLVGRRI